MQKREEETGVMSWGLQQEELTRRGKRKQEGEIPDPGKQQIKHVCICEESKDVWSGCVHESEEDRAVTGDWWVTEKATRLQRRKT